MPRLKNFDNMTSLKLGSQFSELKRIEKAIFLQLWHFPSMPTQPLKLWAMRSVLRFLPKLATDFFLRLGLHGWPQLSWKCGH
jgi:hypothetical protein